MVQYTPRGIAYPDASDSVLPETRDFINLAITATAAITDGVNEAKEAAAFWKGTLASSVNLDTITEPGFYGYWAGNPNNPAGVSGVMFVGQIDSNLVQIAYNFTSPQAWKRSRGASGPWSAWAQISGALVRPRVTTEVTGSLAGLVKEGSWTVYVADNYSDRPALDVNAILDVTWYRDNAWEQTWRTVQDDYAVWKRRTLNSGDTWTEWERVATTRTSGIIPLLDSTGITDLNNLAEEGFWTVRQTDSFANSPDPASNTAVIQCRMYRANGWEQTFRTVMNGNYATWRRHSIDNGANWYPWTQISGAGGGGGGGGGAWTPQDSVFFWGDSAVKGGEAGEAEWPEGAALWERLNALLTTSVENRAVGGYVANNVLLRAGIMRVHARPVGGSIPASGDVDLIMAGQDFTTANGFNMPVTWNGVAGTLIRSNPGGVWFFRRTGSGSASSVESPTELVSSWRQNFTNGTHIFMMAGNDWAQTSGLPDEGSLADHVVATYLRALLAGPATGERHVLLAGVKTRQNTEPGDLNHKFVQHVNDRLREAAPANFVSRQDWLVQNALRARGLTPTAEDQVRMAAGIIPARAFADVTHIHRDVVELEAKELWLPALANRGWVAPNAAGLAALAAMPPRPETPILDDGSIDVKGTPLTTEDLDTIETPGAYWQRQNAEATTARNYPYETAGNLVVTSWHAHDGNITQTYTPAQEFAQGVAIRSRYNGTWTAWTYLGADQAPTVLGDENLDTVTDLGSYLQNQNASATLANNYPWEAVAGNLTVLPLNPNATNYTQVYIPHNSFQTGLATRSFRDGAWTDWAILGSGGGGMGTQLTTEHLDTVTTSGDYWTRLNTDATLAKGYPVEVFGNLRVYAQNNVNDANLTQIYTPNQEWAEGFYLRSRYNTTWGDWAHIASSGGGGSAKVAELTASGLKTVPLVLTAGQTNIADQASRSVRIPVRFNAPITRFRVHIRNWNPRLGHVVEGAVNFTGVWLADTSGNGAVTGSPTQLHGAFTTPADGSEWVSPWQQAPLGDDIDRLLCYGFEAGSAIPWRCVGGSYVASNSTSATSGSVSRVNYVPFDVWIEAETPATTPVVGAIGDSLTVGTGADLPVHESWLSTYCRRVGALPYMIAHHGDSNYGMVTLNTGKVTRFGHLARADAVVWALGSNDIATTRPNSETQGYFNELLPLVEHSVGPVRFFATVQPRGTWDATYEAKRADWNEWVSGRAFVRDVQDFATVVSTDGDTLRPEFDSGDGTHLNTAGYAAEADSIVRALTSRPPAAPGGDTGIVDISALAANRSSGTITFQHKNGWNIITFRGVTLSVTGNHYLFPNGNATLQPWAPEDPVEITETLSLGSVGTDYRRATINYRGGLRLFEMGAGDVVNGALVWPMNRPVPA